MLSAYAGGKVKRFHGKTLEIRKENTLKPLSVQGGCVSLRKQGILYESWSVEIMISFVIPVYRSAETLPELKKRIVDCFEPGGGSFEILLVEDCGGDASWDVIADLVKKDQRVRGFRMSRNYGQHNALLCGIREAWGDVIVTLDDDLQHPPEEIPRLLAKLEEGYDVVYGPPEHGQHGLMRDFFSRITKRILQSAMGVEHARDVSSLRVFRVHLRKAFENYRSPAVNMDVLLTWGTTKFSAVRVRHEARKQGRSGYTAKRLILHAMNLMTGFSTLPLRIATLLGFVFALFGLAALCLVLVRGYLSGSKVSGFVFLASIVSIFSGAQIVAPGIMGEYMSGMYMRMMERPSYVVAEKTGGG